MIRKMHFIASQSILIAMAATTSNHQSQNMLCEAHNFLDFLYFWNSIHESPFFLLGSELMLPFALSTMDGSSWTVLGLRN